jgi:hypothetical protein
MKAQIFEMLGMAKLTSQEEARQEIRRVSMYFYSIAIFYSLALIMLNIMANLNVTTNIIHFVQIFMWCVFGFCLNKYQSKFVAIIATLWSLLAVTSFVLLKEAHPDFSNEVGRDLFINNIILWLFILTASVRALRAKTN